MTKLKEYKMFIDGEWLDSESKKKFETLNPENNEPWATVPEASTKDVDKAVKAAQMAFEGKPAGVFSLYRGRFRLQAGTGRPHPHALRCPGGEDFLRAQPRRNRRADGAIRTGPIVSSGRPRHPRPGPGL